MQNRGYAWNCSQPDQWELSALRGLLGQLTWLASRGIPQWQAPLSVSTILEAHKLARRALVWAHVHDTLCVGWLV